MFIPRFGASASADALRTTDRPNRLPPSEESATCVRSEMGNVQCCARGRFQEGKPSKKTKNNKKINKKQQVDNSVARNGLGGGKREEGVNKVLIVAEDGSERAAPAMAPAETQGQSPVNANGHPVDASRPVEPQREQEALNQSQDNILPQHPNESMAAARERFFGQVSSIKLKFFLIMTWHSNCRKLIQKQKVNNLDASTPCRNKSLLIRRKKTCFINEIIATSDNVNYEN